MEDVVKTNEKGDVGLEKERGIRGNGRVFQRPNSPFWWIAYYLGSREYRESSHSNDEKVARRLLKHRLREVAADRLGAREFVGPAKERVRVSELLDALEADFKLRECYASPIAAHLGTIRKAFGNRRAVSVTEETVDRYINSRLALGKAPATINRETQLLGQSFKFAIRRKVLNSAPTIRHLSTIGNARQGFFEDADFKAVVELLPEHLKDFSRFAYLTGWRKGEISKLQWRDVDQRGKVIHLRAELSKNRTGRILALEGELWNIVERRLACRQTVGRRGEIHLSNYVFHRQGQRLRYFYDSWNLACKRAGLEGKLFHDLRRTAVRNMMRAGVPETVAMKISGHKTRAMFDRYNITSERDLREAVRKTETYLESLPPQRKLIKMPKPK